MSIPPSMLVYGFERVLVFPDFGRDPETKNRFYLEGN